MDGRLPVAISSMRSSKGGIKGALVDVSREKSTGLLPGARDDTVVLGGVEADDPTGLPLIERLSQVGEVDTSGIAAPEAPATPETPAAPEAPEAPEAPAAP